MARRKNIPKWVEQVPQTPLEIKLNGKRYKHHILCSAGISGKIPIGSAGCICLTLIKSLKE